MEKPHRGMFSSARALGLVLVALLLAVATGCAGPRRAKYVFLMIGDGMGLPQRALAEMYAAAVAREGEDVGIARLTMNTFPAQGLTTTHAYDALITDSAAAGTALACGAKTRSGVVSMDPRRETAFRTIAEMAQDAGMRVGIVSSVSIDHATPACFYAHQPNRGQYYEIAMQLPASGFDYFGGGAAKGSLPGAAKGRPSPVEAARKAGYAIATTREQLAAAEPGRRTWAFNHTCDEDAALYYEIDRPEDHISLAEFTRKGIELLDNPRGFFMMVEGGKIDWACHANDAAAALHDILAFDRAIDEAMAFYRKHPQDTLIVVTADHETGGLTLGHALTKYGSFPAKLSAQTMSYIQFDKRVAAWRAARTPFDDALPDIERTFGLASPDAEDLARLRHAYAQSMLQKKERARNDETYRLYGSYEPLTVTCTHILNRQAGIGWTSYSHTGVPVPTSAIGAGRALFDGCHDNTDIFRFVVAAMGLAD